MFFDHRYLRKLPQIVQSSQWKDIQTAFIIAEWVNKLSAWQTAAGPFNPLPRQIKFQVRRLTQTRLSEHPFMWAVASDADGVVPVQSAR